MISKVDLDVLLTYESKSDSPVLSVYLDVDQSRAINLNRGFEKTLKSMLRSIEEQLQDKSQQQQFAAGSERVLAFGSEYVPRARSIAIFCDASAEFFWWEELQVGLRNDAQWGEAPYLRPLIEALDQFERYGVILTDREQARLFTVFMGEIEEHGQAFAPAEIRRAKSTGKDQLWSQTRFQRRVEMVARSHLKQVAGLADKLTARYDFDRLILAGSQEAVAELSRLLPRRLQSRVAATKPLPVNADPQQVLAATLAVEQEVERVHENELVEELMTAAHKQVRAVVGLTAALTALQEGRIWQLVYIEGLTATGWQCDHCLALLATEKERCPYCNGSVLKVEDIVELMVKRVNETGGQVELIRSDEAAARFETVDGIGAYLRF